MFRQIRSKTRFSNWVDLKKDWVALKKFSILLLPCRAIGSVSHRSHFFYYCSDCCPIGVVILWWCWPVTCLKMQTEHLKYVDLVDLHHRFLVQISRQIAPGVAWRPISLTNLESVTGKFVNDLLFVRRSRWIGSNSWNPSKSPWLFSQFK